MTHRPRFTCHGAAGTTTGSRHLIEIAGRRLLLDCGLYQGRRKDTYQRNLNFGFAPDSIDAVLLSHAHIDHSGNLPNLVRQGFVGPIHTTPATADLCRLMLRDSAHIQEKDAEWLNRRRNRRSAKNRGREIEPLYTRADADACLGAFQSLGYGRALALGPGLGARLRDAGHILGSASVTIDWDRDGQPWRLAFSGDIGRAGLPLLRDPEPPRDVDVLVMEGTYGSREHDAVGEAAEELRQAVTGVLESGGKVLIPSFSVERTQEIVYHLNNLHNSGALPPIPVFVDSPLATNVTEVFRLHTDCFDDEARRVMETDPDPFGFQRLRYTRSVEESKGLNGLREPHIIISASGMCEAGRILHHLRNNIADPRTAIVFVGYQAEGTLGRKIVERQETVNIFGEPHPLRAKVFTLNTMSGHADRHELFDYARRVQASSPRLRQVYLVHGEQQGLEALAARLRAELGLEVTVAEAGKSYAL